MKESASAAMLYLALAVLLGIALEASGVFMRSVGAASTDQIGGHVRYPHSPGCAISHFRSPGGFRAGLIGSPEPVKSGTRASW